ncbi:MAG TPA: 7TM diverse intracellular signaling domain-containing protein [Polyangiales bacterium]|nr:7TM diverse intracellular signaling domain-containing protein [Polyangiales bacterium]
MDGWRSLALGVLVLAFATRAHAQFTLDPGVSGEPLGKQLASFADESRTLTIEQVTSAQFAPVSVDAPSFGLTRTPIWFRFTVRNPRAQVQPWILELGYPHLDRVELYVPRDDGSWDARKTGDLLPFDHRELDHRNFMFRLNEPAYGERTFYLRVQTEGSLSVPLFAWSTAQLLRHEERELPLLWMLYGVILVMALYNAFLYFAIRRVEYLYYVSYNLSLLLLEFALTGQAFQFVYPSSPWLANHMVPVLVASTFASTAMFIRSFLSLDSTLPAVSRIYQLSGWVTCGLIAYSLLGPYALALRAVLALAVVLTAVSLYAAFVLVARGQRAARFFLFAWGCLLGGVILYLGKTYGVLANTTVSEWGVQVGAALEVVLLSLALADRINEMRANMSELNAQLSHTVAELQGALDAAEQATRAKGDFLATMSHELRTPLNTIINIPQGLLLDFQRDDAALCKACESLFELSPGERFDVGTSCPHCSAVGTLQAQRITRYLGRPEQTVHHLALIERAGKHLLQMVDGVLDFSKLEARALRLKLTPIELGTLVHDALETVSELAKRASLPLTLTLAPELAAQLLVADPLRIKQVLINLIANAIKFSNGRGAVTVSVEREATSFLFAVRDQGIGIAPEHVGRIFERFEQVEQGDTRRYGGSGLGLSISRSLVEMHAGAIWVESTPNVGSTFYFRLPVAGPTPEDKEPEEPISMVLNRVPRLSKSELSKEVGS